MDCRSSLARAERRYRQRQLKKILEIGLHFLFADLQNIPEPRQTFWTDLILPLHQAPEPTVGLEL